ncbi:MAG: peptidoglycan DD-metalloendopeptidase family protein [Burkholderiales bacterium]
MQKIRLIGLASVIWMLVACSTQRNAAPVMERNAAGQMAPVPHSDSVVKSVTPAGDEHGYYTVKKGDTLLRIALDNGQNYRDLVAWNNLANPNDIKVDQVLRVLPPDAAGGNVQVASVAMPVPGVRVPLTAAGGQPQPAVAAINKSGPHGEKRPYSEAALAEMQKMDAAPLANAPKAPDNAVETGTAEQETVVWMWPVEGKPAVPYEDAKKGIDIAGKSGQQVVAAASGRVLYAGVMRGYGNLVIVKHSSSLLSAYAHNKIILVKEGQTVAKGQPIAEMGDSDTDSVKLHFEIRQQGKPVDPTKFLPVR